MGWPSAIPIEHGKIASNQVRFDTSLERECNEDRQTTARLPSILRPSSFNRVSTTTRLDDVRADSNLNAGSDSRQHIVPK